ncbi:MAG TPA: hypothetical protein PKE47_14960, partial [Verrucomicrobiota bacterium]|nr:hypothetical protein [Verrucomicrobiota bacterium]
MKRAILASLLLPSALFAAAPAPVPPAGRPSASGAGESLDPRAAFGGSGGVFTSHADNLVTNDHNGRPDVFFADLNQFRVELVSVATNGRAALGASRDARVSYDGRRVVFVSDAPDLAPGDTNGVADLFLRDRAAGTTTLLTPGADGPSGEPELTPDGHHLVFTSAASNLVPGDTNRLPDAFLLTLTNGVLTRLSAPALAGRPAGESGGARLSGNGGTAVFPAEG